MTRPYDNIPRQGEHLDDALDTEPTTNVRAQEAAHPLRKSKETQREHVLMENKTEGSYRIQVVPKGSRPTEEEDYDVVARIPEAGDVAALYRRLPDDARHAVFEHTGEGTVYYAPGKQPSGDWTDDATFDRVTLFRAPDEAEAYSKAQRNASSAE